MTKKFNDETLIDNITMGDMQVSFSLMM